MTYMAAPPHANPPLRLRASPHLMVTLEIGDMTPTAFEAALAAQIAATPSLFWKTPLVLDLTGLAPDAAGDVPGILATLGQFGLVPAAAQARRGPVLDAAEAAGIAPLLGSVAPAEPAERRSTMVVRHPIRSGQCLHADGTDLVVLGPVSAGAEISADGCIHVYGALRGAAFAGAGGDSDARIYAKNLNPSRVSIAGLWLGAEEIPEAWRGRPAEVRIAEGLLRFEPLP
ncbi:septum site-determining protein MinC [Paracraurococcus lichenis]|uniref:Probable septum site-determining protein MinC n=1 Tax=Paracraurococcus lichenis TaxID=3064888 RepID=A0ABT9EA79_9PROT|nr:septum site-determining protein MinC [Paracraurococcus sp. LOR1-02]MDO9713037.1 septum site-determining protein MinC [Paracraurococcus sp. LOR1-02]